LARLAGEQRAQVTIIGGGYTGLSTALHLAEAGRAAVVLEAADVGERASGLNGGQVIPGVKYDPDTLEEMFGTDLGGRLVETVARGPDLVFELIRKYEIACDAVRQGWIQPATSEPLLRRVDRSAWWHGTASLLCTRVGVRGVTQRQSDFSAESGDEALPFGRRVAGRDSSRQCYESSRRSGDGRLRR
jgi:glycine/D-amino acid oxidase-like deaminating enzyme